jgi:hypothetical protein
MIDVGSNWHANATHHKIENIANAPAGVTDT